MLLLRPRDPRLAVEPQPPLVLGVIRLSSSPGRCTSTVLRQPTSLSVPMLWLTIPPRSSPYPPHGDPCWQYHQSLPDYSKPDQRVRKRRIRPRYGAVLGKLATASARCQEELESPLPDWPNGPTRVAVTSRAVVPGRREHRPHGQPDLVGPDAPGLAQVLDDAEPAAADRRRRGVTGVRNRRAAAIADREFDAGPVDCPGHLQPLAWQRVGVQDRVAEQFADDEDGVPDRAIEDPGGPEFVGQCPAREGDAGRGTRQVDDARRPHLPCHPPRRRGATLSALRKSDSRPDAAGNRPEPRRCSQ